MQIWHTENKPIISHSSALPRDSSLKTCKHFTNLNICAEEARAIFEKARSRENIEICDQAIRAHAIGCRVYRFNCRGVELLNCQMISCAALLDPLMFDSQCYHMALGRGAFMIYLQWFHIMNSEWNGSAIVFEWWWNHFVSPFFSGESCQLGRSWASWSRRWNVHSL